MPEQNKKYDIILFGATGYTGSLVAEYLAEAQSREAFRWAIAGRSLKKLNALRKSLLRQQGHSHDIGIIKADVNEQASLQLMAEQANVIVSTVGPYVEYGEPVVRACVQAQAHYVDLTGEPEFVDHMRHKFHEEARDKGLRIVNCCGFDSIPHDLGVLFTVSALAKQVEADIRGEPVTVEGFVSGGGEFSGGTWHSAVKAFSRWRDYQKVRRYWLQQARQALPTTNRVVKALPMDLRYQDDLEAWAVPFPTIDPQIVRRSARAYEEYGARFDYGHYVLVKRLPKVVGSAAMLGGVFALSQLQTTRNWLLSYKEQGQGPSERARQGGWFKVTFKARSSRCALVAEVSGGDPGYQETAKMLSESALCLVRDIEQLPDHSGVITPAMAMGHPLIQRLQQAGLCFEVKEVA